jgi:hypothetical protein
VKAGGLISVVAFGDSAGVTQTRGKQPIGAEGFLRYGSGTNFGAALRAAIPLVETQTAGLPNRIVFFTDGKGKVPVDEVDEIRRLNCQLDAVGIGAARRDVLEQLICGKGEVMTGTVANLGTMFGRLAASSLKAPRLGSP